MWCVELDSFPYLLVALLVGAIPRPCMIWDVATKSRTWAQKTCLLLLVFVVPWWDIPVQESVLPREIIEFVGILSHFELFWKDMMEQVCYHNWQSWQPYINHTIQPTFETAICLQCHLRSRLAIWPPVKPVWALRSILKSDLFARPAEKACFATSCSTFFRGRVFIKTIWLAFIK